MPTADRADSAERGATSRWDASGPLATAWFAVGVVLTTATRLRPTVAPVGPGELMLLAWLGLAGLTLARGRRIETPPVARVFGAFWIGSGILLVLGGALSIAEGRFDGKVLHNALALPFTASVVLAFLILPRLEERCLTFARWYVAAATAPLLVLFLFHIGGPAQNVSPFSPLELRFFGWSHNPNQVAILLAPVPFLALWLFGRARSGPEASGWFAAAGMAAYVGFATRSDALVAGWVLAAFAGAVVLLMRASRRGPHHPALLPLAALAVAVIAAPLFADEIGAKWEDLRGRGDQVNVRFALWEHGIDAVRASPLVGHGPGAFSGKDAPFQGYEAHNTFIDWAASTGLVGLALLIAALGWVLWSGWRERPLLLTAAIAAPIGLSLFHFVARHPAFWMAIATAHVLAQHGAARWGRPTTILTGGAVDVRH